MSHFNLKGAALIALTIVALFGAIEFYGLSVVGDWEILNPTIVCQLLAITVAVAPMIYGMVYASHHED
jgi:hypothetical protein